MADLLTLLRDPASQTAAVWLMVAGLFVHQQSIRRLFARQDDLAQKQATLEGAHDTAERLNACPMSALKDKLSACPLLAITGHHPGETR